MVQTQFFEKTKKLSKTLAKLIKEEKARIQVTDTTPQ